MNTMYYKEQTQFITKVMNVMNYYCNTLTKQNTDSTLGNRHTSSVKTG